MLDGWLFPLAISAVSFFWKLLYLQSLTQIHVLLFSCSVVSDSFLTPWTAACQASLSFPVPEFAQIHVHWVGDAIQLSHPLLSPSPPALHFSQHQGPFPVSQFFTSGGQSIGASASAAVLLVNIQGWFPLELTDLISLQSKGLSRVFNTTVQKHQFFGAQPSLWFNSHIHTWLLEKPWLWLDGTLLIK